MRILQYLQASWRSHPVRLAAVAGAAVGFGNTLITEIGALLHKNSGGALNMLVPSSMFGSGVNGTRVIQTAMVLIIEAGTEVLVWMVLFVVPVALFVWIRRTIRGH